MGWTYSKTTRAELIRELIQLHDTDAGRYETVAHTLCENVLWAVVRITAKRAGTFNLDVGQSTSVIACYLLDRDGSSWGYKSLGEETHPYYYSCPLAYLDMAPEQSAEWRARVREHHARESRESAGQSASALAR